MPWARLDDSFHDNPKIVDLLEEDNGCAAVGLYIVCLTWAHRHTRNKPTTEQRGFIGHAIPRKLIGQGWSPLADLLCKHNLWELRDGGWRIHDFDDPAYVPEDRLRARRAELGRQGGLKSAQVRAERASQLLLEGSKLLPDGTKEPENSRARASNDSRSGQANAGVGKGSSKDSPSSDGSVREGGAAKRGTRIPADFTVTADMVKWARERCPHVDGKLETEKFINFWMAKAGQAATKVDWVRTWQNWMLSASERAPTASPRKGTDTIDPGFWER